MHRALTIAFLLLIYLSPALQAQTFATAPEKPKLILYIIVEQMRQDYLPRFQDKLGAGGFRRLQEQGFWCRDARYTSALNQSAPAHATLATGVYPSFHGIVSDYWYNRTSRKWEDAVADEKESTVGGSYEAGRVSPRQLTATTLGDELRLNTRKLSLIYSIAWDAAPAVLSAGHHANGAFWIDEQTGNWVTSTFYKEIPLAFLQSYNLRQIPASHASRTWMTRFPTHTYATCWPDLNAYEKGFGGRTTFPYNLQEMLRNKSLTDKMGTLRATPFANTIIKDMAVALLEREPLGKDGYTDMLTITFSGTEHIGRLFGPQSIEMEDAFLWLDQDLEQLFASVDAQVGMENTLVVLTATHGMATPPAYTGEDSNAAGYFNTNSAISLLRSYLNALYGEGDWLTGYRNRQGYLNRELIEKSGKSFEAVAQTAAAFLSEFSGVSSAITSKQLAEYPAGGLLIQQRNSFHPLRSGDILVTLAPGWTEKTERVSESDSPYPYDVRVPLFWMGWKIPRGTHGEPVDLTDVATTVAEMLHIQAPGAASGKILLPLLP